MSTGSFADVLFYVTLLIPKDALFRRQPLMFSFFHVLLPCLVNHVSM